jgi:hypothetical protein
MRFVLLLAAVACATAPAKPPPAAPVAVPVAPPAPAIEAPPPHAPLPPDSEILPAPVVDDPSLMAILRIKEPLELAHRLGISDETLRQKIPGFDPADVHPGNAALFAWEPPAAGGPPALLGLLPLAADSGFARKQQARQPALKLAPLGKDTLLAVDPSVLSKEAPRGPTLRALAMTPTRDEISLDLNVVTFLAHYGAPMHQFIDRMQGQMDAQANTPGQMSSGKQLNAFLAGMADYATLSLGARVLPESYRLSLVTREKTPQPVEAKPASEVEAVRYLPPASLRMQFNGRLSEKTAAWSKSFFSNLVTPSSALLGSALAENMEQQAKLAKSLRQGAISFSLSAEHVVHILTLFESTEAAALHDLIMKQMMTMSDPKARAELAQYHLACSVKRQKAARKIEGVPVDKVVASCKPKGKPTPDVAAFVSKLYPMTVELAQVGDTLAGEINGTDLTRVVHDLVAKTPSGTPLAAGTVFSEPAFFRSDLDVARLIREINQMAPEKRLPEPAGAPPVIVADGRESSGATEYRTEIPKSAVAAIYAIIQQLGPQAGGAP